MLLLQEKWSPDKWLSKMEGLVQKERYMLWISMFWIKLIWGATTHFSYITRGFFSIQTINGNEHFLYLGNKMKARIEGIRMYKLILDTSCHLDLKKCLIVLDYVWNLVSVEKLDEFGFNFKIGHNVFSLYKQQYYYGSCALMNDLYHFNLDKQFVVSLVNVTHEFGLKYSAQNEHYAFLWCQRLDHISKKKRVMRLVKS